MTSTAGLFGAVGNVNYSAAKMGIVGLARNIAFDMQRFNVRSNIIAPSAFSRMIETVPGASPEAQAAYLEKRKQSTPPDRIAPLAVFLVSDAAKEVNGQILGARGNEVYLFSQSRPIRTAQREGGWTVEQLAERLAPAWKNAFTPLERTGDVFPYPAI